MHIDMMNILYFVAVIQQVYCGFLDITDDEDNLASIWQNNSELIITFNVIKIIFNIYSILSSMFNIFFVLDNKASPKHKFSSNYLPIIVFCFFFLEIFIN